jgi:tRNA G18 (ribose-2'-O)-methylase SpoU
MIEIHSIESPNIKVYKSLRGTSTELIENHLFIAEGERVVCKLLNSDLEVVSLFATSKYYEKYGEKIKGKNIPDDQMYVASKEIMEQVVGFRVHTGIMALAKQPEDTELCKLSNKIVVLNGVIDSENVGSIVRNSVAFGFDSLIYDNHSSCPYLRRAVRVSMGSVFHLKVHRSNNLYLTINELKKMGYEIISAELCDGAIPINELSLSNKVVIIFGSEGYGISEDILSLSDKIVFIPISKNINSLNVASSSSIILYYLANL